MAVFPSIPSVRRFFTLGSSSTRKSMSSLKDNLSFFLMNQQRPYHYRMLSTLSVYQYEVLILCGCNAKGPQVKRRIYLEYREMLRICAKFSDILHLPIKAKDRRRLRSCHFLSNICRFFCLVVLFALEYESVIRI